MTGLRELYEEALRCNKCGFCQATCPIYREINEEPLNARGRIRLIKAVLEGDFEESDHYEEILSKCLFCRACVTTCPSGIKTDRIILAARQDLVKKGGLPTRERILLENILPYPKVLALLFRLLGYLPKSIVNRLPGGDFSFLRTMDWVGLQVAKRPFRTQVPELVSTGNSSSKKVAFFFGCLIDYTLTEVGHSLLNLLRRNKIDILIPKGQKCCGMPLYLSGEVETAKKLARDNIILFNRLKVEAIVTACARCGSILKNEYMELFKDEAQFIGEVKKFSERVFDISAFLVDKVGIDQSHLGEVKAKVTYHDPCHLIRGQGISQQPRTILTSIPGLEFKELIEADRCCGSRGLFKGNYLETFLPVTARKLQNIRETKSELVATGCPFCLHRLQGAVNLNSLSLRPIHTIQLLDSAYRSKESERGRRNTVLEVEDICP